MKLQASKYWILLVVFGFTVTPTLTYGQIGKKFREKTQKVQAAFNNPADFAKKESLGLLKKSKAKMDSASFGYAIALSDNAGLFENKETLDDVRNGVLVLFEDENDKEPLDVANNYKDAGEMSYAANEYRAAEVAFYTSILVFEANGLDNHVNYPGVVADLGLLNHTMGRFGKSLEFTNRSLQIRKELLGEESNAYAASLNNLAVLQKDMGLYSDAEGTLLEALEITKETSDVSLAYAIMLNNQANLYQTLGRFDKAEELLLQSISISEDVQGKKSTSHQRLLTNLAILYQVKGNYEEAESIFSSVIELKEKRLGKNHPDYAHMLNNLAALYVLMGKDDDVVDLLTRARNIYEKKLGQNHPSYAANTAHLGNFYRYKKEYSEAEPFLKEALFIRENILGKNHPDYAQSLEDLGMLYWEIGELEDAALSFDESIALSQTFIESFFPAMSESEKNSYWEKLQPRFFKYFSFLTHVASEQRDASTKLLESRVATKALLLNSSVKIRKSILSSGNQELIDHYLVWVDLKESLAGYYTYSQKELFDQNVNIDSLENLVNINEKYLSEGSEVFKQGYFIESPKLDEIKVALNPDEAAVEIIQIPDFERTATGNSEYFALVVSPEKDTPDLVRINSSEQLDDKFFKFYRNSIRLKRPDDQSYQQFWAPVVPYIQDKNQIYLSNDGIFNQVNINTLQGPEGFELFRTDISVITNLSSLLDPNNEQKFQNTPNDEIFLLGFPNYGESAEILPLPGTEKEVGQIEVMMAPHAKINLFMGDEATEEAVKNIQNQMIIHIATHGFFMTDQEIPDNRNVFGIAPSVALENPMMRSGLLLKGASFAFHDQDHVELNEGNNGVLTAYEVMNQNLDETRLVVLSACETALGDIKTGEGVYGLQRAFLIAGADALIMSLWKVDDGATQKLMTAFYSNLLTTSFDFKQSLKNAQLEVKNEYPDPYYWGAFVLVKK